MNNALPLPENEKLSGKCSSPGASRPLAYSVELYDKTAEMDCFKGFSFSSFSYESSRESKTCDTFSFSAL